MHLRQSVMGHPTLATNAGDMKIGIIGTGNMGRVLGTAWARKGHAVLFGSRDLEKAKRVASEATKTARAGSFDDAATFGDVVLYTIRDVPPSKLLKDPSALDGKILVDCNNSDFLDVTKATFPVSMPNESIAERIAADVPNVRVVKAFNTHPATVLAIAPDLLRPQRVTAFVTGDDPTARAVVRGLAEDVGLAPVDSGGLERAYLVEALADFLRFHIVSGLGVYATLSLGIVKENGHV